MTIGRPGAAACRRARRGIVARRLKRVSRSENSRRKGTRLIFRDLTGRRSRSPTRVHRPDRTSVTRTSSCPPAVVRGRVFFSVYVAVETLEAIRREKGCWLVNGLTKSATGHVASRVLLSVLEGRERGNPIWVLPVPGQCRLLWRGCARVCRRKCPNLSGQCVPITASGLLGKEPLVDRLM